MDVGGFGEGCEMLRFVCVRHRLKSVRRPAEASGTVEASGTINMIVSERI